MDPNATLANIQRFLTNHETGDDVDLWCEDLFDWIRRGGFEPDWSAHLRHRNLKYQGLDDAPGYWLYGHYLPIA